MTAPGVSTEDAHAGMPRVVDGVRIDPNELTQGPLSERERLAKENVLDHYKHPRNKRAVPHATHAARDKNPLCGDELAFEVRVDDDTVRDAGFSGTGCAISLASASMVTKRLVGMRVAQVRTMGQEDVLAMLGIPIGIVRRKCAMLGLRVAQQALAHDGRDGHKQTAHAHEGHARGR